MSPQFLMLAEPSVLSSVPHPLFTLGTFFDVSEDPPMCEDSQREGDGYFERGFDERA